MAYTNRTFVRQARAPQKAWVAWLITGLLGLAPAATPMAATPTKPAPTASPSKATPGATKRAPAAAAPTRAGKGWSVAPIPGWVTPVAHDATPASGGASTQYRQDLVDLQSNFSLPQAQYFARTRSTASDASALSAVSQWQLGFNPAYQRIMVHTATVTRGGVTLDKLKDAQLELMRREQGLEKSMITGVETLLMLLTDVRVGDTVEVAYTVEGSNPIFEGKIESQQSMASSTPISAFHWRLLAPATRPLQTKSLGGDFQPELRQLGDLQELRLVRRMVEPIIEEKETPPWVKVYPALLVSEYRTWAEVAAWGERVFQPSAVSDAALDQKVEEFRASGQSGAALVALVLRFVQDDVQYFSVSLDQSSHRPKPAPRTLADRSGDCKDKVTLLNTLLTRLGFDAKPALVATHRHKGLAQFLPGTSEFDHVITRVLLDGRDIYLDPTLSSQGKNLDTRGQPSWGAALLVAPGSELQVIAEPPPGVNRMEFLQNWDLSKPGAPAVLNATTRVHGLLAEAYRRGLAQAGVGPIAESLTSVYPRAYSGLKTDGAPEVADNLDSNMLEVRQRFVAQEFGEYANGLLTYDLGNAELFEALAAPAEPKRKYAYRLGWVQQVDSSIVALAPRTLNVKAPAPSEVADKHFRLTTRVQINGKQIQVQRNWERRAMEVLPADLDAYRQQAQRARNQLSSRVRLPLIDQDMIAKDFERLDRLTKTLIGGREDSLYRLVLREQATQVRDTQVLLQAQQPSALARSALISRGESHNHLAEFADALKDADAALAQAPDSEPARDVRGVALVGLGRLDEALQEFAKVETFEARSGARYWMGQILVHLGRYAEAEKLLQQALADSGGEQRDFVLLWLYLAAEGANKQGLQTITPYLDAADEKKLPGALLRYLGGKMDRAAVLRVAEESADMRRMNLAEAYFYFGQQARLQGDTAKFKSHMREVLDTKALPYREHTFAVLALQKP